jgi:hypothetical protein
VKGHGLSAYPRDGAGFVSVTTGAGSTRYRHDHVLSKRNPAALAAGGASEQVRSGRTTHPVADIAILVEPIDHHGRFRAYADGRMIVASSRQPLLDVARALMSQGHDPLTMLVLRHAGSGIDSLMATIGVAARLTVEERKDGTKTPRFAPWKPWERAERSPKIAPRRQPVAGHRPIRNARQEGPLPGSSTARPDVLCGGAAT